MAKMVVHKKETIVEDTEKDHIVLIKKELYDLGRIKKLSVVQRLRKKTIEQRLEKPITITDGCKYTDIMDIMDIMDIGDVELHEDALVDLGVAYKLVFEKSVRVTSKDIVYKEGYILYCRLKDVDYARNDMPDDVKLSRQTERYRLNYINRKRGAKHG